DRSKWELSHLCIVGDFFDFWFCDSGNFYPEFGKMIDKLLELKKAGTAVALFEGNHDFFMTDFFERYGIQVFPDDAVVDLEGKKCFISHGDRIDTSNKGYLLLRRILRSSTFYKIQKITPSNVLWRIAAVSSRTSKNYFAKPPEGLIKKMRSFALKKFEKNIDAVILGHTHEALMEEYSINGSSRIFVLLGDWINRYSYLSYKNGQFQLMRYNG
ncbi:MAG: UDP-2,3-diacylglucosamine diphosphatase, partial [Syntrophales bacterium]|nr:UDP-2,3-diacylglucosamine diphosphatase [Syntrophales bacterium]